MAKVSRDNDALRPSLSVGLPRDGVVRVEWPGKQTGYLKMIAQTRDDALEQLAEHARTLGANAVLGMRFDSGEFDTGQGQAMNEVTAYGTEVAVEG